MLFFANEIHGLLEKRAALHAITEKTASAGIALEVQNASATSASQIYEVLRKEASCVMAAGDDVRIVALVDKMAQVMERPIPTKILRLKIAAAVLADIALDDALGRTKEAADRTDVATQQLYGREYICDLLTGAL